VNAQESSVKDKAKTELSPTESGQATVNRFLPFRVGSRWTYKVSEESEVGSGKTAHMESSNGQYSETVVGVQTFASIVQLVELRRNGTAPAYDSCRTDEPRTDLHFWYLIDRFTVYTSCNEVEATELASSLSKSSSNSVPEDGPDYVLPFQLGAFWGADPTMPKRDDTFYQWTVEAKSPVTVPAENFQDCYELAYRTLPDHEERWVCAGVGLVADEYTHNGTPEHYRIELQSFTHGPNGSAK
jgi:hypothetical protein